MKNSKNKGYFAFVLHAHIPYVLEHGTWPHGAVWLYEAAAETYLPLLRVFLRLVAEGISPRVTISITPVLAEQLNSKVFKENFRKYLEENTERAKKDEEVFNRAGFKNRARVARLWGDFYLSDLKLFDSIKGDIMGILSLLAKEGHIELITSAATHGYLPLLLEDRSVKAQVALGIDVFKRIFGFSPKGIWPPELAYRPSYNWKPPVGDYQERARRGLDEIYKELGLEYFLIDTHLLKGGRAIGTYLSRFPALRKYWKRFEEEVKPREKELSPRRAYLCGKDGEPTLAFFVRDPKTALQVWSKDWGYPGDPAYLEFHKKAFPSGLRYWRVTGRDVDLADKDEYDPEMAKVPLENQSDHFLELVGRILEEEESDAPIVVSPYDAELFGHWWFEGPEWLYLVLRKSKDRGISPITLSEYLEKEPPVDIIELPEGSWGEGGFHYVWLNDDTQWIWKLIYRAELEFYKIELPEDQEKLRILKQMARELLLLQSSDWPFLITTWSARDYAEMRAQEHYERFMTLLKFLIDERKEGSVEYLSKVEKLDSVFDNLDLRMFGF